MRTLPRLKTSVVIAVTIMSTVALLLSTVGSGIAQETRGVSDTHRSAMPSPARDPTDLAELEAFLDEFFARQMTEHHIAGAGVSVVKDGKVLIAKGYGSANLEKGTPVDPAATIFRIGSVTKLFTWTAVMQLVEQGKLDLEADINRYLDFRIPETFPQPITLNHLMTHTAGFEDRLLGSVVSDTNDLVPVREWLISHMSARVHPPGAVTGYANYNAVLAGYIVARVSGQPYAQYIQDNILDPLGMAHSTAQEPIPPALRAHASVGYTYVDGAFRAFPEYIGQPAGAPSGALRTSVTDMARFMIAHLEHGRYRDDTIAGARILEESTARRMHTSLYTPDPRLLGMAYGFADLSDNGQRTLGHEGYFPPMHSLLLLVPDQNLGLFVTFNTMGTGDLTTQHLGFQRAFFDHYYPVPAVAPLQSPPDFAARAGRFVGVYRYASSPHTTLIKIVELFGAYRANISAPGDGTLRLTTMGLELRFVEVEPLYFRQVDGPFAMIFREDDRGHITHMYTDYMPQYTNVKLDWYETSGFHMALALGCVVIFLSMIPIALMRVFRDRRLVGDRSPTLRGAHIGLWIIVGISTLNLLFLVGTVLWGNPPTELGSISLIARVVLGLGVVAAVLTVGALATMVLAWKNSYWGVAFRAYVTLVTGAAVGFVWLLNYWNLLGWRY